MLSTQTKQINAYGKRGKRVVQVTANDSKSQSKEIVSIFDDLPPPPARAPLASRMKGRENSTPKKKAPAPKIVGAQRKKRLSPPLSPVKKPIRISELMKESTMKPDTGVQASKAKVKVVPLARLKADAASNSPARPPLSSHSVNVPAMPASPSRAGKAGMKPRIPSTKAAPSNLGKVPPLVNMDIIVLDDDGRTISRERRVSRTGVTPNTINQLLKPKAEKLAPKTMSKVPIYVDSESEAEIVSQPKQEKLRRRAPRVVVSDGSDDEFPAPPPPSKANANNVKPLDRAATAVKAPEPSMSKPLKRSSTIEILVPPAPYATKQIPRISELPKASRPAVPPAKPRASVMPTRAPAFHLPNSPVLKARQLTPIRAGRSKGLFEPPSPPSPSTSDFDLSLDFEDLSLESEGFDGSPLIDASIPAYLKPLLEECGQEDCGPHDFSSFIESFPFDPILQAARERERDLFFKKIGEASYSEVFGIGDVVLKVIPLRDESATSGGRRILKARGSIGHEDVEGEAPPPTDAQDVRKEIVVTHAMGEVHKGFVKLLKTYVVKGKYPEALLNLWDEYYEENGSESIRPDTFSLSQAYAIIVLPNGGPDLETYTFSSPSRSGWRQACSIFWQVAKSLAHAEHLVSFEHRDLHWGQILVKNITSRKAKLNAISMNSGPKSRSVKRVAMDDLEHGVQVTIIDLGLSRMDAGDGSDGQRVQWTPFDEEIFMGEGDYQFDVYRMMRELTSGDWEDYHPMTNVMWLHYLASKLLRAKALKAPPATKKARVAGEAQSASSEVSGFSERECYEALTDLEQWLGQTLMDVFPGQAKATAAKVRGRRATLAPAAMHLSRNQVPACAGEVVEYGVKRGWVSASKLF